MGKRKQPFGYCMDAGHIVIHPQEAETVQYVFRRYISGASFSLIANALNIRAVLYDQGKPWNKNIVFRNKLAHVKQLNAENPVFIGKINGIEHRCDSQFCAMMRERLIRYGHWFNEVYDKLEKRSQ